MNNDVKFDLEERTGNFGKNVINFSKTITQDAITRPLISQMVRSATSIGANYCEADDAQSRADFKHKIAICKKEARETMHWMRMIIEVDDKLKGKAGELKQEAKELNLIFNAIIKKTESNSKK